MITARAFAGKHYAVLGLARSGLATVATLVASGAKVTAWDDNEDAPLNLPGAGRGTSKAGGGVGADPSTIASSGNGPPPRSGAVLEIRDFTTTDLTRFDSIVVTPGLPLNRHPIAAAAKAAGVEIIGDIELFARARSELPPHKVVGITGTNGKSTTTALVHHILQTAGVPSLMGGNIGLPILSQDPLPKGGVYVLELSSYQMDLTKTLDCEVAVLLNVTPDHLDRYDGFEAYAASKARLFEMQTLHRHAIVGYVASMDQDVLDNVEVELWEQWIDRVETGNQQFWPELQGAHNLQNAQAATAACRAIGLIDEQIFVGLESFPGLPHRMERVCERHSVTFINDSKATNAEAAAPALAAFEKVRWIVGGQAKADTLGDTAKHLDHVRSAYTIGEAGAMFARLLGEAGVAAAECGTLEVAVKAAAHDAEPGDTVLLSPACASFDQFRDFEARGDAFRELVRAL